MKINTYILIIILILYIVCKVIPIKKEKKNLLFLKISCIVLFLILAIREPISDMNNYLNYFEYLNTASFSEILNLNLEFLYKILNIVIARIWNNTKFFMIVIDLIGVIASYYFIKRYSKNYLISVMLFVTIGSYYMQFFILRQAIAIAILMFSVRYIEEKNFKKFLVCVVIATLFHKSSIIFVLAYFICNVQISFKYISMWMIIYGITFVFRSVIIKIVSGYLYTEYADIMVVGEGYGRLLLFSLILIFAVIVDIIMGTNKKNKKVLTKRDNGDQLSIFYNLVLLTIFFQILATKSSIICRLGNDFCNGAIILLPNVVEKLKNENTKVLILFCIIVMILIYSIYVPGILNYTTIWK